MKKVWFVPFVLAGGVLGVYRASGGCLSKDPDQKLAGRFGDLCGIADDGADDPVKGVKKLGRYLGTHTDDMLGDFGGTLQMIERIKDDDSHDERARIARDRLVKPWIECADAWDRFGDAIESNQEALELLQHGVDRFGRTLDIIFGDGKSLDARDFRHLPSALMHRFDALTDQ